MGFLDNIVGKLKDVRSSIGNVLKNNSEQAQNQNSINNVMPQAQTKPQQPATNNILSKINPQTWNGGTRQTVANILLGIGRTPYNYNKGSFGSLIDGINQGLNNQINYNNTKNILAQYGVNPESLSPYADYSNIGADDLVKLGLQQRRYQITRDIAAERDATKRNEMIWKYMGTGQIDPDTGKAMLEANNVYIPGNLNESNNTRKTENNILKTNSQINLNNARIKKINADIQQNAQKIEILKQKVNQGTITSQEKSILNQLNIRNKELLIEQNELINQGMREQLSSGGTNSTRPVGSYGNVEKDPLNLFQ